jgi:type I restriction enzyme M protein
VSTAVLFLTRGAQTKDIWFYDMAHDGFSLDDKRVAIDENDIPDVVGCWKRRFDKKFNDIRYSRIEELRKLLAPMKAERLKLQADINRISFELAVDSGSNSISAADGKKHPEGAIAPEVSPTKHYLSPQPSGGGYRPERNLRDGSNRIIEYQIPNIFSPI